MIVVIEKPNRAMVAWGWGWGCRAALALRQGCTRNIGSLAEGLIPVGHQFNVLKRFYTLSDKSGNRLARQVKMIAAGLVTRPLTRPESDDENKTGRSSCVGIPWGHGHHEFTTRLMKSGDALRPRKPNRGAAQPRDASLWLDHLVGIIGGLPSRRRQ